MVRSRIKRSSLKMWGLKRTTLSSIYVHSDKIIRDYEAGVTTATRKEQENMVLRM